jgi:hypothetical protein
MPPLEQLKAAIEQAAEYLKLSGIEVPEDEASITEAFLDWQKATRDEMDLKLRKAAEELRAEYPILGTAAKAEVSDFDAIGSSETVRNALILHEQNTGNPHNVTVEQIGAEKAGAIAVLKEQLDYHEQERDNPHEVTASQTGAPRLVERAKPGNIVEFAIDGELSDSGKALTDLAPAKHTHPTPVYPGGRGNVIQDDNAVVGNLPMYDATNGRTLKDSGYKPTDFEAAQTKGNLTATAPVALSATRQVIGGAAVVSIPKATGSVDGYLAAADFTTFAAKQAALSFPLASTLGGTGVNNAGTLTNATATTITGGGTLALAGYTLTVPATGAAALLGIANVFSAANTFGSAGNGTLVSSAGRLTMTGTGRVKKEVRIESSRAKKGAAAPSDAERAVGASGGIIEPVLTFSKTTQNDCYFVIHTPSDMDATAAAQFHLMWQPGASWSTGNYMWKLEYLVKNESGATLLAGAPTTIFANVTPANATTNIETEFVGDITMSADQLMLCHFYRDVANDNADDIGCVVFFELEYTANCLGEAT